MDQLIQNPGRPSQGGGSDSNNHKSGNIFANKVRKANNNPANNVPRIESNDNNLNVSSGADDGESDEEEGSGDEEDYDDNETPSEKEWNMKQEVEFEQICLGLLNAHNWNALAVESKRHL